LLFKLNCVISFFQFYPFMKKAFKCVLLLGFICFHIQSYAQLMLDDVNMEMIHQKTIRKYIAAQIKENKHQFTEIQPSWNIGKDLSLYSKNEMTFFLKGNFKDIWKGYLSENPSNSWNGRKVSFGVLLQKFPNNIFYNHDQITGINTGQVYFLNLKLLKGIYNIPVAFEIIVVDTVENVIEFSYIKGNKSSGVQQIKFLDMGNDRTQILHTSYFKSDSHFRDRRIYPFFHKKIVNDFHRNMRRLLNLEKLNNKVKDELQMSASCLCCSENESDKQHI